ncbi:MAG: gamma-glutamyltransferase, partial [Pirellulaceae bacterium]
TGNGIGGDLFAIVWIQSDQKLHGLNASGRSPESLTIERLREELEKAGRQSIPPTGPLPVSVPGCVDGWFELHRKFGKLPMPQVLAPAIRYAREGFPVSELIAYYWRRSEGLARFPGFAETFLPGGRAPSKGDIFRNPLLADTLQQ